MLPHDIETYADALGEIADRLCLMDEDSGLVNLYRTKVLIEVEALSWDARERVRLMRAEGEDWRDAKIEFLQEEVRRLSEALQESERLRGAHGNVSPSLIASGHDNLHGSTGDAWEGRITLSVARRLDGTIGDWRYRTEDVEGETITEGELDLKGEGRLILRTTASTVMWQLSDDPETYSRPLGTEPMGVDLSDRV